MLDTYRKMEANGAIGKMMKLGPNGQPVYDPEGKIAGHLVTRPFQEYPKIIRRFQMSVDDAGKSVTRTIETVVNSKAEELVVLGEKIENVIDMPLSPLERERDELAARNAEQGKTIESMQEQMTAMMAQMTALAQRVDRGNAEQVALHGNAPKHEAAPSPATGKGLEALALGKK
jgi:hypothetical protein